MEQVTFKGKTYFLTEQAVMVNHGTDGAVRYRAEATDEWDKLYNVFWSTTAQWDAAQEQAHCQQMISDGERHLDDVLIWKRALENSISDHGDLENFGDDESDACDWENPVEVEAID